MCVKFQVLGRAKAEGNHGKLGLRYDEEKVEPKAGLLSLAIPEAYRRHVKGVQKEGVATRKIEE